MHMPANNAVDFTPPPAGTFLAVSYRLIEAWYDAGAARPLAREPAVSEWRSRR